MDKRYEVWKIYIRAITKEENRHEKARNKIINKYWKNK